MAESSRPVRGCSTSVAQSSSNTSCAAADHPAHLTPVALDSPRRDPNPLTPLDQTLLTHLFTGQGNPLTLALSRGMSLAEFLTWHTNPRIQQAVADLEAIQNAAARRTIITELKALITTTTDPIEKRRVAATLLRALNRPPSPRSPGRSAEARRGDEGSDARSLQAAAGAAPTATRPGRGGMSPDREGGGTGAAPQTRCERSSIDQADNVQSGNDQSTTDRSSNDSGSPTGFPTHISPALAELLASDPLTALLDKNGEIDRSKLNALADKYEAEDDAEGEVEDDQDDQDLDDEADDDQVSDFADSGCELSSPQSPDSSSNTRPFRPKPG